MNNFAELKYKIDKIKDLGWIKCKNNNCNIAGITLEKLLGKETENFPIADYNGIEIKTHHNKGKSRITLFSCKPDSFLFENKRLVTLYGYPDKQYPQFNVLNNIISCNKLTYVGNNHYLTLIVDRNKKKLILNVYRGPFHLIDNLTSWSFEALEERIKLKLNYLCYVKFEKNWYKNDLYIKYTDDLYYNFKDFDNFINLIENGIICITIKLGIFKSGKKFGQLHDHGTSFNISEENLELLYKKVVFKNNF